MINGFVHSERAGRINLNEWVVFKHPGSETSKSVVRQAGKGPFKVVDIEAYGNGLDYIILEDIRGKRPDYPVPEKYLKKISPDFILPN